MTNIPQHVKVAADALSLGAVISTLATWLPAWAALFSIVLRKASRFSAEEYDAQYGGH